MRTHQNPIKRNLFLLFVIIFGIQISISAQSKVVTGKVYDAKTGDPIAFANVFFTGTQIGMTTDFDGNFSISSSKVYDSVSVTYIGYIGQTKKITGGVNQILEFRLDENVINLDEVVILAGENPAFPIMRNVIKNKDKNDKRKLEAYEFDSYTKIEIDVDNISDKLKEKKPIKKVKAVLDSIQMVVDDEGNAILPVLFSEAASRYYFRSNPYFRYEHILKTKVSGVGITDGTTTSQFLGASFQQYNFYQNWLTLIDKEFVSPLADSWRAYYDFYLTDSIQISDDFCYQLEFSPKNSQDLAFTGTVWITKNEFAVKQIDLFVPKTANLNFVEKIRIQQELIKTDAGPWLPSKTRVMINVAELTKNTAGMLGKFYASNSNYKVNEPHETSFYEHPITMKEDYRVEDPVFWLDKRPEPLSEADLKVYNMIDTLNKIPSFKTYLDLAKIISDTYVKAGKVEIGPYTGMFAQNDFEGNRFGFGLKTNFKFSQKWLLNGLVGYGTLDERWKYDFSAKYIINRLPWTTLTYRYRKELDPIWVLNDEIDTSSLFYTSSRFGLLENPFMHTSHTLAFQRQSGPGWINKFIVKVQDFKPDYGFQYETIPGDPNTEVASNYSTTELIWDIRYAKDEKFIIDDNERFSLGTTRSPLIKLRYTVGVKNLLGGDFNYQKLEGSISRNQKLGTLGTSSFSFSGQYIFNDLPYPLLKAHIGNESPFFINFAYNLMNYYEFTTDHHAAFRWRHHFEGLILNRIPLMKLLKWRLTTNADILYGGIRDSNYNLFIPTADYLAPPFAKMDSRPYMELGYGVENIFKIFRVDFFHRMTYLEQPDVRKFGVKVSFQFIL